MYHSNRNYLDNDECFPISAPTTKENLDKAKHFVLVSNLYFTAVFFPLKYLFLYILAFTCPSW